ncbi:uncharacterized protein LOC117640740 isoform X2 [Thrips palmi]|uniref:Uncharacterized protein LOC117640740 isoform X2 n=1 Tax=Thrips palmi TaxID=161013 RepID=A0A6P8YHR0_THRPL|nr:uncharacterized protein LOC117640740 isoform X2 [Thrips palmi]
MILYKFTMECQVCLEQFNLVERRPKVLPCGHSYCLKCLQQLPTKVCPLDKKEFLAAPEELVDNFSLLDTPNSAPRFWCVSCKKEASAECVEDHAVRSLKKERAAEAERHLEALQQGKEGLSKLQATLVSAYHYFDLEKCLEKLQREMADLDTARERVQDAMEADSGGWERAKETAVPGGLARDAVRLLADLTDPSVECSVTVRRGDVAAWEGVVKPAGKPEARLLLCRLACFGQLKQSAQQDDHRDVVHWEESTNTANIPGALMKPSMVIGSRVARVWRHGQCGYEKYKDFEGTPPGPGIVTAFCYDGDAVSVKWHRTGLVGTYWMKPFHYDLRPLPPQMEANVGAAPRALCVDSISACADMKPKWKLLADTSFGKVHTLVGLHCEPDPQWSLTVLQQVAPHLEGLQLVTPKQQHIDLVATMSRLKHLSITNLAGEQLREVSNMASLRSLEVHCQFAAPLPKLTFPATPVGLQWLRCGVHPLSTALALARAHADTLEELQLVAASRLPYGCPDLAQQLQRCGFKKLKKIVLLRQDAYDNFCRHGEPSCKKQALHIMYFLSESNLSVDVLCSACNPEKFKTK